MYFGANYTYKRKIKLSSPDRISYTGIDSGCTEATRFLQSQSRCIECPFKKCLLDGKKERKPRRTRE